VLTQVVSRPEPGMAVVDAGWKAVSTEDGVPGVAHSPGATFEIAGDEHGIVRSPDGPIDQFVWLIPSHCDTTVNLYDVYHLVSGGRPIGTLPVAARGAVT
jgi:D-serine deaminase-like pyridoxal phosphate-dependent protein